MKATKMDTDARIASDSVQVLRSIFPRTVKAR